MERPVIAKLWGRLYLADQQQCGFQMEFYEGSGSLLDSLRPMIKQIEGRIEQQGGKGKREEEESEAA